MGIDGILNLLKPPGKTSFDLVALVRRGSGERKVGHAGTLDPAATGVLVVCLGQGTRLVEFLSASTKLYRAQIELGVATDTYDATGRVTRRGEVSLITRECVEEALNPFRGSIQQIPPMYSAARHEGKRLYELARVGIEVVRKPKPVYISRLELLGWQSPVLAVEVECSAGTFIRSLADDLGQTLGCGAHLKELVRLRCGPFDITQAVSLSDLEEGFRNGSWRDSLQPVDEILMDWDAAIVSEAEEASLRQGRSLELKRLGEPSSRQARCRAYSSAGEFVAVLSWRAGEGHWHPDKVFRPRAGGCATENVCRH